MGSRHQQLFALVLCGILGFASLGMGEGCDEESNLSNEIDLTGVWEGSGKFTNNCPNPACLYRGTMNPPSVTLDLIHLANKVDGTATLNLPQGEVILDGNPCGPLSGQIEIFDGTVDGTRLTLTSYEGGAEITWNLNFTNDLLEGDYIATTVNCNGFISNDIKLSRR